MVRIPQQCCEICKAIPFADLPSEEEPAIRHQPSLQALKDSAASCTLCDLILQAALDIRTVVERNHSGRGLGGFIRYSGRPCNLSSGEQGMGQTIIGNFAAGHFASEMPGEEEATNTPGFQFGDDSSVSPWLYGNWWKRDPSDSSLQLMGLGVRLAATSNIEDAEGNDTMFRPPDGRTLRNIIWHGSYLRVITEDGM